MMDGRQLLFINPHKRVILKSRRGSLSRRQWNYRVKLFSSRFTLHYTFCSFSAFMFHLLIFSKIIKVSFWLLSAEENGKKLFPPRARSAREILLFVHDNKISLFTSTHRTSTRDGFS